LFCRGDNCDWETSLYGNGFTNTLGLHSACVERHESRRVKRFEAWRAKQDAVTEAESESEAEADDA